MKKFSCIAPGFGPYSADFYGENEADARRQYAKFLGKSRCPKGTSVWES